MLRLKLLFLLCSLSTTSCGYRWQMESPCGGGRPTISVPYVLGDSDGSLTSAIIHSLAISGVGDVRQSEAGYRLQVSISGMESHTIGYRRDRQQISGELRKNLVSSEARKTIVVEATLYENGENKIVCGPCRIEEDSDFDYVDGDSIQDLTFLAKGREIVVLPFSLGQLESSESAEEAAMRPLNTRIAQKIIDVIFAQW